MALLTVEQVNRVAYDVMHHTHEEEIAMLNSIDALGARFEAGEGVGEALAQKLEAYVEHVIDHFDTEEQLMQVHGFPAYQMHKMEHDRVLQQFDEVYKAWKASDDLMIMVNFLRSTPEWIINHIATMDTITAMHIKQRVEAASVS